MEQRKETENDDHVVQVGDDRRHGEAPFEAQRQIRDDAEADQQQRQRAVLVELLADLRPDEFDPLLGDAGVVGAQRRHHALGELCGRHAFLQRQPDQGAGGAAESLHRELTQVHLVDGGTHARQVGGMPI